MLIMLATTPSYAVESILLSELSRECASNAAGKDVPEKCVFYISGFLDGVVSTNARASENTADEFRRKETFSQRAIRTRSGNRNWYSSAPVSTEFCIGEPIPVAEITKTLMRDLSKVPPAGDELARDTVFSLLRTHFPCRE